MKPNSHLTNALFTADYNLSIHSNEYLDSVMAAATRQMPQTTNHIRLKMTVIFSPPQIDYWGRVFQHD